MVFPKWFSLAKVEAYKYTVTTCNLYCRHLKLDKYNDISEGRGEHRSEGTYLNFKETQSSQGSNAFNFLKDI